MPATRRRPLLNEFGRDISQPHATAPAPPPEPHRPSFAISAAAARRSRVALLLAIHADRDLVVELGAGEFGVHEATIRSDIARIQCSWREAIQIDPVDLAAQARATVMGDLNEARLDRAWPAVAALHRVRMQLEGTAAPEKHQVTVDHGSLEGRALVERFLASRGVVAAGEQKQVELEAVVVEGEAVGYATVSQASQPLPTSGYTSATVSQAGGERVRRQKPTAAQEPAEASGEGDGSPEAAETVYGAPGKPGDKAEGGSDGAGGDRAVMPWDEEAWEEGSGTERY